MFLSQRQCITRLSEGVGIGHRQAAEVLGCGLAGEPVQAAPQYAYRSEAVDELLARPVLSRERLLELCRRGKVMVVRRSLGAARHWEGRERLLRDGWRMSSYTRGLLRVQLHLIHPLCFLALAGSYVVFGADLVDVHPSGAGTARLSLREPGTWYDDLKGVRLDLPAHTPWTMLGW